MPQRRKRVKCFSPLENPLHIFFSLQHPPLLKDVLTFRKNLKEENSACAFQPLKKGNGSSAFLHLRKLLRICFSLTRPCFLKMHFRLEKTVTHLCKFTELLPFDISIIKKKPLPIHWHSASSNCIYWCLWKILYPKIYNYYTYTYLHSSFHI